jgi:hypothetical protein
MIQIKQGQVALMTMCKIKWLVHHLNPLSKQVQAIKVPILQPTNIARDHPLDTIIEDISRDIQIRSKLASFCEYFSFVSFIELKKIEETLRDTDWANAMYEKLNNFTRN